MQKQVTIYPLISNEEMIFYTLVILGSICHILGIIGCILPILPGPVLNYIGLLLIHFAKTPPIFSLTFLIIFGVLTTVISLLDYVLPLMGAKLCGASKYGLWGSIIGMIIGTLFFPPFGTIFGILIGAISGELIAGKNNSEALKAGIISFISNIFALFIKLSLSFIMFFYFIINLFP